MIASLKPPVAFSEKRTKIVCTLGPASSSEAVIKDLMVAGADVFRLNFSHSTHAEHQNNIHLIRHLAREMNHPVAVLADLSGPKLRIGAVPDEGVTLKEGDRITLTSEDADGTGHRFQVSFGGLSEVASVGQRILMDDGALLFEVEEIEGEEVRCRTLAGGMLTSRKGVNLPDTPLPIPALTEKDRQDLAFALRHGVDFVALSFVRKVEDIGETRKLIREHGKNTPILAKIEKKEAVEELEEILREADGAMVARGDLGIEIPMEDVPAVQKRIISLCNQMAKPVITATQMLDSMIHSPRPTRAEVTDIFNAILDGTDAVMLSGETASGSYPTTAVQVMDTVASAAEKNLVWNKGLDWLVHDLSPLTTQVLCNSAVTIAERLNVDLIIVPTQTGDAARHVAQFRPRLPIFAVSPDERVVNCLSLTWGVVARPLPALIEEEVERCPADALVNEAIRTARRYGVIQSGQTAVILGGLPLGKTPVTNYLRVVEIP